ncbi:Ig-like domain-containing protein [Aeromonas enteropelogenes]|uniref:Ig-like domain-containing protein n=1 Tax=Aeromonas enteropelogenes TaxID=29489 RepID=UPI003F7ADDBA
MRQNIKGLAAFAMLAMAAPASAQVYEMSYTDTNATTVIKGPTLTWYNPNSAITVTHIAGLDRRVKLELLKGTTVLQTQTSNILTVANRIVASDGTEFYGVKLSISKPSEGSYILRSTIYDINNVQVSSNDYAFNVDLTAPVISGDFTFTLGGWSEGSIAVFGQDNIQNKIGITGITDASSGLSSAEYFATDKNGVTRTKSVTLASGSPSSISILCKDAAATAITPIDHSSYTIGVRVTDKAGNIGSKSRVSEIDNSMPSFDVEVWNSVANAWQPYKSATTYQNPLKARYKFLRSNHVAYNGTNYGITYAITNTDATYAYSEFTVVVPAVYTYNAIQTRSGVEQSYSHTNFNSVTMGSGAVAGPDLVSTSYGINSGSLVSGNTVKQSTVGVINKFQTTVEARPYAQTVTVNGATCTIPVGSTTCTLNPNVNHASGRGYIPYAHQITNQSDTAISTHVGYLYTYWDFNAPTITSLTSEAANKQVRLVVNDADRINNWQIDQFDTKSISVVAKNNSTGVSVSLPLKESTDTSIWEKVRVFDTSALGTGAYTLTATATDTYGNAATKTLTLSSVDNTPPSIAMKYLGGALPNEIQSIKDLRVLVTDALDTSPVVTRMTIVGGPINDELELGFTKQSSGWAPEVPRMFPTLETGQDYTIKVDALDNQGNTATLSKTFSLSPSNLVRHGAINLLPASQSLLDINDKPLGQISFQGALTDGGSQSRGVQAGYFTLRRDAEFSVMFNGTRVEPGETKDVVIPLNAEGYVTLPVWPADADVIGKATYMIDIPQLTAN